MNTNFGVIQMEGPLKVLAAQPRSGPICGPKPSPVAVSFLKVYCRLTTLARTAGEAVRVVNHSEVHAGPVSPVELHVVL
jgi:hypothetical protein